MGTPPIAPLGAAVIILISIFLAFAMVTVALRVYSIRIVRRKYRSHDYLIFLAMVALSYLSN